MEAQARRKLLLATGCVVSLLAVRALLSAYLIKQGFRALSDDDYSRVVVAQSFALRPSLDPSQTSWLPFPFWLYGAVMKICGGTIATARATAFGIGLLSVLGVWQASRWLGLSRGASWLGALLTCLIPYSAWLGATTTPDVYSASLLLLGCCSLSRRRWAIRALGAVAVVAAALSRYEAWPVALVWALFAAVDGIRTRHWKHWTLLVLVVTPAIWWLLHGLSLHHNALFFVQRVTAYRRALGVSGARLSTPWHFFSDVPELWALASVAIVAAIHWKIRFWRAHWLRPAWGVASVLVFLCWSDWRGGAATHHVGRTVLVAWYFSAVLVAACLNRTVRVIGWHRRALFIPLVITVCILTAGIIRPRLTTIDGFCLRHEEVLIGELAAARVAPGQRLAIDTRDYGYFAVQAGFARPNDTVIVERHDPRSDPLPDPWRTSSNALRVLTNQRVQWVVAPVTRQDQLSEIAEIDYRGSTLLLARLN